MSISTLLQGFALHSGLLPREIKSLDLETTVERFYEKVLSTYGEKAHLILDLKVPDGTAGYVEYYSQLALNLDSPLVKEMYGLLRDGKIARFSGKLSISAEFSEWPFTKDLRGILNGKITIEDKTYFVEFDSYRNSFWEKGGIIYPRLVRIMERINKNF